MKARVLLIFLYNLLRTALLLLPSLHIDPRLQVLTEILAFSLHFLALLNLGCILQSIELPGGSYGKASAYNEGDPGSIPGLGRSPGDGKGNPLQYSCLENPMDGGAW